MKCCSIYAYEIIQFFSILWNQSYEFIIKYAGTGSVKSPQPPLSSWKCVRISENGKAVLSILARFN